MILEFVPVSIKLSAPGGVGVTWNDGHQSVYPYGYLRGHCPCATCTENPDTSWKEPELTLPILGQEARRAFRVTGASQVGHYAIQFTWNDGHNTGLYSFGYLREICPCELCRVSV